VNTENQIGCKYSKERTSFRVWAPKQNRLGLHILHPFDRLIDLHRVSEEYFQLDVEGLPLGATYKYRLDSSDERPDPASLYQPEGVFGPSQVCDLEFNWHDRAWKGIPLDKYIIYELHVGTFTPAGTFQGIKNRIDYLLDLGVTAIELMPVGQFPGTRNWGYDVIYPFAVQNSYGLPEDLMDLVDAFHARGIAVILDVVYNHFGPEGNYLHEFGHYFSDRYHTPWGDGINFDGPYSDEVRHYFIQNAVQWVSDFHFDALRLDATHSIFDFSAQPFLKELATSVNRVAMDTGRSIYLIAENNLNDPRLIIPQKENGFGLNAVWNDDFHHALHVMLTNEKDGYYQDYEGIHDLGKSFKEAFVYSGEYSSFSKCKRGARADYLNRSCFVVFGQNHDQVGNRAKGDRLHSTLTFEKQKIMAACVILSPFVPLLFMGEEYGEQSPFLYFINHSDPELVEAVRKGRQLEFNLNSDQIPDPQDEQTYRESRLKGPSAETRCTTLQSFYRELIRLRKSFEPYDLANIKSQIINDEALVIDWTGQQAKYAFYIHHGSKAITLRPEGPPGIKWHKQLDSCDEKWLGPGSNLPEVFNVNSTINLEPGQVLLLKQVTGLSQAPNSNMTGTA